MSGGAGRGGGREELRRLARLYGVLPSFREIGGRVRHAPPESLVAALRALGAPVEGPADAAAALRARRAALRGRLAPPSAVVWEGTPAAIPVRAPAAADRLEASLELEEGGLLEWAVRLADLYPSRSVGGEGLPLAARPLPLPVVLPRGVHRLRMRAGGSEGATLVIAAPPRAWRLPRTERGWGIFLPLYAVRSEGAWGVGRFADLAGLARIAARHGGRLVWTLPLLASFLDVPFAPGPYVPASRLLWNELFTDLDGGPGLGDAPGARAHLADPDLRGEIEALRSAPLVDYRRAAALHRRVLGMLASRFFDAGGERNPDFRRFLEETPEAADYARFRAAGDRWRAPWRAWPARQRDGDLRAGDFDEAAARRHLYAQWVAERQLAAAGDAAGDAGCALCLDLPLGVHPDGYDTWRERALYAGGIAVGAPPDPFADEGQDWGFPPLLPELLVEDGYRHYRRILRAHMRHAGLLRVDHVMGLHRLFWVPAGMTAREGVYVRYPTDDLYALLCLESWRHGCEVVGEDLGTVPPPVRETMRRRGVLRSYVLMFELPPRRGEPPAPVPEDCVASLGTHDLSPFAAFWRSLDVESRLARTGAPLGEAEARRRAARDARDRLAAFLERWGLPAGEEAPDAALTAALSFLAASPARHVVVSLEDAWGETEPQNVPGTAEEVPNWRRRARLSLEEIATDARIGGLLARIGRERRAAWPAVRAGDPAGPAGGGEGGTAPAGRREGG